MNKYFKYSECEVSGQSNSFIGVGMVTFKLWDTEILSDKMKDTKICYICKRQCRKDQWAGDPDGDFMCWWCAFHDGQISNPDYQSLKNKENHVTGASTNNCVQIPTKIIYGENDGKKK